MAETRYRTCGNYLPTYRPLPFTALTRLYSIIWELLTLQPRGQGHRQGILIYVIISHEKPLPIYTSYPLSTILSSEMRHTLSAEEEGRVLEQMLNLPKGIQRLTRNSLRVWDPFGYNLQYCRTNDILWLPTLVLTKPLPIVTHEKHRTSMQQ